MRPGAVRGGPCQGGRVFRPTQHRLRHLHRLLHQLPTVMWPVVLLVCGGDAAAIVLIMLILLHARTHADEVHARGVAIFLCC